MVELTVTLNVLNLSVNVLLLFVNVESLVGIGKKVEELVELKACTDVELTVGLFPRSVKICSLVKFTH